MLNIQGENSMLDINKNIILTWEETIKILKEVEYILCSLHDMGSYYADKDIREYEKETTRFIDKSRVTSRLADIRKLLTEKIDLELGNDDMDDIEREMIKIPYWRQPGDIYNGKL